MEIENAMNNLKRYNNKVVTLKKNLTRENFDEYCKALHSRNVWLKECQRLEIQTLVYN